MNFKRYVEASDTWIDSHYIKGTDTDTITSLPATIYPLAQTATIGLKGNAAQNGTPTPQNPIMPQGTGDKTANLFDIKTFQDGMHLDITTGLPTPFGGNRIATMQPIDVSQYNNVTVTYDEISHGATFMYSIFNGDTLIERVVNKKSGDAIDTSNATKMYLSLYPCIVSDVIYIMGNAGSTPLPYEPYGIKIPISSAGQTTPIYLGEVETTRKIRKLVFDGTEEGWEKSATSTRAGCFVLKGFGTGVTEKAMYCTHATYVSTASQLTSNNTCYIGNDFNIWLDLFNAQTTNEQFKAYLAQQYAAGTPVTIWYVLATEETAVVNEPLMKIGNYADSISGISITTTAGANTLDVDTTVKPSEVTATFNGWHPVSSAHERSGGSWN